MKKSFCFNLFITIGFAALFLYLFFPNQIVQAQGASCANPLPNATVFLNKQDKAYGARATITYTNPSLNSTAYLAFSYHRVAVAQNFSGGSNDPFYFIEFGWLKSNRYAINGSVPTSIPFGAWRGPNGDTAQLAFTGTTWAPTTYNYEVRLIRNPDRWVIRLGGNDIYSVSANLIGFTAGDDLVAGGEVCYGIEQMNCIYTNNLQWFKLKGSGQYVWRGWDSWQLGVQTPPYSNYGNGAQNYFYTRDNQLLCLPPPP